MHSEAQSNCSRFRGFIDGRTNTGKATTTRMAHQATCTARLCSSLATPGFSRPCETPNAASAPTVGVQRVDSIVLVRYLAVEGSVKRSFRKCVKVSRARDFDNCNLKGCGRKEQQDAERESTTRCEVLWRAQPYKDTSFSAPGT